MPHVHWKNATEHSQIHVQLLMRWSELKDHLEEVDDLLCELQDYVFDLVCGDDCFQVSR